MKVGKMITPLLPLTTEVILQYSNEGTAKRPIKKVFDTIVAGTPLIRFVSVDDVNKMTPGQRVNFVLTVTLTKMRTPLFIEA